MQPNINSKPYELGNHQLERVSNEFAMVHFSKVRVGNGERLLLKNPSSGDYVLLDAVVLEAIVDLGNDELSKLVEKVRE